MFGLKMIMSPSNFKDSSKLAEWVFEPSSPIELYHDVDP